MGLKMAVPAKATWCKIINVWRIPLIFSFSYKIIKIRRNIHTNKQLVLYSIQYSILFHMPEQIIESNIWLITLSLYNKIWNSYKISKDKRSVCFAILFSLFSFQLLLSQPFYSLYLSLSLRSWLPLFPLHQPVLSQFHVNDYVLYHKIILSLT